MGSPTTNYGFTKPTVGGDSSAWGTELNSSLDAIDTDLKAVSNVANAALPSTSYTAADVLTKIKTVDGSGSGLDADTLDGKDSSYFLNAGNIASGSLPLAQLPGLAYRAATAVGSARITISTAGPSGGTTGDIWLQY